MPEFFPWSADAHCPWSDTLRKHRKLEKSCFSIKESHKLFFDETKQMVFPVHLCEAVITPFLLFYSQVTSLRALVNHKSLQVIPH